MFKICKRFALLSLLLVITAITGCYPILQSAELTPPKKFKHTIRTGVFIDDYSITDGTFPNGFGYHLGYGINKHLEVNTEIDLVWPRVSIGAKTELIDKLAFATNINASVSAHKNFLIYPDICLVYGYKTYFGVKAIPLIENKIEDFSGQLFIGKKYNAFNKFQIIPEISFNTLGHINLGLGFEF